jgi:hypothetical protein
LDRLISIERRIKDIVADQADDGTIPQGDSIDCPWIEQRIFQLGQDTPEPSFAEDPSGLVLDMMRNCDNRSSAVGMIILGEAGCCNLMLEDVFMTSSPRK